MPCGHCGHNIVLYSGVLYSNENEVDSTYMLCYAVSKKNFCQVYKVSYNAQSLDAMVKKIKQVSDCYDEVWNDSRTTGLMDTLGATEDIQRENFSKSLVFLKIGMGYSNQLAAAVLANWYHEGAFSETNKQNADGENSVDDSKTYTYKVGDNVGFGIMQWTIECRKQTLWETAKSMSSGVGNINVQFATFQKEIGAGGVCENAWKMVVEKKGLKDYTTTFMSEMEKPLIPNQAEREKTADKIYKAIKGMIGGKQK